MDEYAEFWNFMPAPDELDCTTIASKGTFLKPFATEEYFDIDGNGYDRRYVRLGCFFAMGTAPLHTSQSFASVTVFYREAARERRRPRWQRLQMNRTIIGAIM
jgi:hypothetical protein